MSTIDRADDDYLHRLFLKAEVGGAWWLHRHGIEPIYPTGVALDTRALAFVNDSRWVVVCPAPGCGGAQLASPDFPRLFCVDCANAAVGYAWIEVDWPEPGFVEAVESILSARPEEESRRWLPIETIGALVAENHEHGLIDEDEGRVLGDTGYDQAALGYDATVLAVGAAPVPGMVIAYDPARAHELVGASKRELG